MSYEPPPLEGTTELQTDRAGYSSRLSYWESFFASNGALFVLCCLLWLFGKVLQATVWPGVKVALVIFVGAIVVLTVVFVGLEWWLKKQLTPAVTVINGFVPGKPVTVEVGADPSKIHRVEVLATTKKYSKNHDGDTVSTNIRVADQHLDPVPQDEPQNRLAARYRGVVPFVAQTRKKKWFVAVHLVGNRGIRYVRPFPVLVSLDQST